ncbi:MAG: hypothetical protein RL557_315 [archaeon]|jgi:small subunit ribosomal protein S15
MQKLKSIREKGKLEKPVWLKYSEDEVRSIILKLADKGLTAEKIGLVLKDQYGIPKVKLYNFKIKDVLKDRFQEPTILNLQKKVEKITAHNQRYRNDKKAGRAMIITKAKLKKRSEYQER